MYNKEVDGIIYLIGSWTKASMPATAVQKTPLPFAIWSDANKASFSLVGAGVTKGSLEDLGYYPKFIYGKADEKQALDSAISWARGAKAYSRLRGSTFGLIGGRSMAMYTAMTDPSQVKSLFGSEIVHVDQLETKIRAEKIKDERAEKILKELKKEYGEVNPSEKVMMKSAKLYLATKDLVEDMDFDFIGVKCQPEMIDNYVSYCLTVALLNNEGIVTSCEADINAALTMEVMKQIAGPPVLFADVNHIDREKNVLRLVNCGSIATDFAADKKNVEWNTQYEYMGKSRGSTPTFCCREGEVTLARLGRRSGEYVMVFGKGKAFERPKETFKESRDIWPHAFVRLDGDPERFLNNLLSNHLHMVYGDITEELWDFCELVGIEPVTF